VERWGRRHMAMDAALCAQTMLGSAGRCGTALLSYAAFSVVAPRSAVLSALLRPDLPPTKKTNWRRGDC
jgi:hypothetical protein